MEISHQIEIFQREHRDLVQELHHLDRDITLLLREEPDLARAQWVLDQLHSLLQERLLPHCAREKHALSLILKEVGFDARMIRELLFEDSSLRRECERLQRVLSQGSVAPKDFVRLLRMGERLIARVLHHIRSEEQVFSPFVGGGR